VYEQTLFYLTCAIVACLLIRLRPSYNQPNNQHALKAGFINPPNTAKPGVYWYFMDGNMTEASITKDLESMKKAGIGNLVFLEVNVGVPRGPIDFLSPQWQDLFVHAVRESERLDIEITLGIGPGWTGSGGPWVKPEQSMQHLVSAAIKVAGGESKHQTAHTVRLKSPTLARAPSPQN
jgi:hypothetical protein